MLKIVDDYNNNGELTITDSGDKLKFSIKEHNKASNEMDIKLGLNNLKKLHENLSAAVEMSEEDFSEISGESYVLNKKKKFLEVEFCEINYGFVIGILGMFGQSDWVVISVREDEMEDIVKELERKIKELEEEL